MVLTFIFIIIFWLLIITSGISNAVMDCVDDHFEKSIFKDCHFIWKYWNKNETWKNKYKDDLVTPKFPGSTTILVMFTDPWHFFKMLCFFSLIIAIPCAMAVAILSVNFFLQKWWILFIIPVIIKLVHQFTFHAFFTWIFSKKS